MVRVRTGWWKSSFLSYMRTLYTWYTSIPMRVDESNRKLQALLYARCLKHFGPREDARSILYRRISAWFPQLTLPMMDRFFLNSFVLVENTQPYLLVGIYRFLCRGLCSSRRFHARSAGCLLGCRDDGSQDLDSVEHYSRCPRLAALFRRWL
eukprot:4567663-Pyramimonas_sp.AAC.1